MPSNEDLKLGKFRYRLYREHKYIFHLFCELLQKIAKANFCFDEDRKMIQTEIYNLHLLLNAHAAHEESRIHKLLQEKGSELYLKASQDHDEQNQFFDLINGKINALAQGDMSLDEVNFCGHEIYLDVRRFFVANLEHFDYEERVLMPELQKLLTDEEIRGIDAISYQQMLPDQIIDMIAVLFPHMNLDDKFVFLNDIKEFEPEKFHFAWRGIAPKLGKNERESIIGKLGMR